MSTISRNDLCPCGSNKKFKKCCQKNKHEFTEDYFKRKVIGDKFNRVFSTIQKPIWRKSLKNLPTNLKNTLNQYLRNEHVVEYGCYYNSSHLSLYEPKIKTVQGWYGFKIGKDEVEEIKSVKNSTSRFIKLKDELDTQIVDTKKCIIYNIHSWNSFEGIHFDLTTEGNQTFNKWVEYNVSEIKDFMTEYNNNELKKYFENEIKSIKLQGVITGKRLLNENLIKIIQN